MKHVPQEIRKTETQNKITNAALLLFSTKGYYKTTSKDIAKAAGVSIGSFYTYFQDKKALLLHILNTYVEKSFDLPSEINFSQSISTLSRTLIFETLIERSFSFHTFTLGFYKQVTMLSTHDEDIGSVFKDYQDSILIKIKNILLYYVPNLSLELQNSASVIIYSAIEGSIHTVQFSQSDLDAQSVKNELVRFLDAYISALS